MLLYATLGGQWAFGSRITYSFAPDGTSLGGPTSALFQAMANRGFSTQQWQNEVREAAAVWSAVANINLVEVSDDGSPYSTPGNQQSDSRFGDVRFAGMDLGQGVLGLSYLPPDFNGGTLAGDIIFNTTIAWQINSNYDLRTVAIHEIGHALGMDHTQVQQAVMYAAYTGLKQALNSDDVLGIQSIYQTRQADPYEPYNNSFYFAPSLNSLIDGNKQVRLAGLDITTASDNDWYTVHAPYGASSTATFTIQSSELSSLSPKVLVYNASLQLIGSASLPNSYGATATVTINGVAAGQRYYVRLMAANAGASGVGAYGLLINFGGGSIDPIAPPNTVVPEAPSQGGGSINYGTDETFVFARGQGWSQDGVLQLGDLAGHGEVLRAADHNGRGWRWRNDAYLGRGPRGGIDHPGSAGDGVIHVAADASDPAGQVDTTTGVDPDTARRGRATAWLDALDELLDDWAADPGSGPNA